MISGLAISQPKRKPIVSGPKLFPKAKTKPRSLYLGADMWDELDEATEFHSRVFEALGSGQKVSRNDVIEAFLRWALDAYWDDKGGRPKSEKERRDKAVRHAEALKKTGEN